MLTLRLKKDKACIANITTSNTADTFTSNIDSSANSCSLTIQNIPIPPDIPDYQGMQIYNDIEIESSDYAIAPSIMDTVKMSFSAPKSAAVSPKIIGYWINPVFDPTYPTNLGYFGGSYDPSIITSTVRDMIAKGVEDLVPTSINLTLSKNYTQAMVIEEAERIGLDTYPPWRYSNHHHYQGTPAPLLPTGSVRQRVGSIRSGNYDYSTLNLDRDIFGIANGYMDGSTNRQDYFILFVQGRYQTRKNEVTTTHEVSIEVRLEVDYAYE